MRAEKDLASMKLARLAAGTVLGLRPGKAGA
jgi:hypothetical protein